MNIIEFIDSERDVVLRRKFEDARSFVEAIFNLPALIAEVALLTHTEVVFAEAFRDNKLVSKVCADDLHSTILHRALTQDTYLADALPHSPDIVWSKLWLEPDHKKIAAYMRVIGVSEKTLPWFMQITSTNFKMTIDDVFEVDIIKFLVKAEEPKLVFAVFADGTSKAIGYVDETTFAEMVLHSSPYITVTRIYDWYKQP